MHTIRRYPVFQIFYSTTFTVLSIALLCLLLITPGDIVRQALKSRQIYNIFIIIGSYVLTLIFTIIIYASRLYTNRTVLADIPKAWIPIEKGDVSIKVWRMITEGLCRSAFVAYTSRPRNLQADDDDDHHHHHMVEKTAATNTAEKGRFGRRKNKRRMDGSKVEEAFAITSKTTTTPFWGRIEHPGWSAPSASDFPSLHYRAVISELPHLIEAKAVSLAPQVSVGDEAQPEPHPRAIALLRRPATLGMRDYLTYLSGMRVVKAASSTRMDFVARYEQARFSDEDLSEANFRTLMNLFADLLRSMTELDEDILAQIRAEDDDDDDEVVSSSAPSTRQDSGVVSKQSSLGTIRTAPPTRHRMSSGTTPASVSSSRPWMTTASNTPFIPHTEASSSSSSRSSMISSPSPGQAESDDDAHSMASSSSTDDLSVIRNARVDDDDDDEDDDEGSSPHTFGSPDGVV